MQQKDFTRQSLPAVKRLPAKWPWLRMHVFDRDGWQCVQCGRRGRLECDHKIPREAGGSDDMDNLQTLCRRCHIQKTKADVGNPDPPGVAEWDEFMSLGRSARRRKRGA